MSIIIRDAKIEDASKIHELIENTYRGDKAKIGWTFESDLIDGPRLQVGEIADCLTDNNQKSFVAIEQSRNIVGVIFVARNQDWIEFGKFSVEPKMQGQNIGKKLIQRVSEFVRDEWKAKTLKLMVISKRRELVKFYERQGFVATGEKYPFIKIHPYVILKDPSEELEVIVMERSVV